MNQRCEHCPKDATHGIRFAHCYKYTHLSPGGGVWFLDTSRSATRLWCRWHATCTAVQRNAALRRRPMPREVAP